MHLDARWIPHRTSCHPWIDQTPCRSTDSSNATSRTNTLRTSFFTSMILDFVQQVARYEEDNIKCGGFFWRLKRCCMVACILMHDRFHTAYDVAHGFIEFPAVRGLTKRNSERHSPHQWFLISCNKLHATGLHKIKYGGFFWRLKRCWNPPHFLGFNIVRHGSVHLDARRILRRTQCRPRIYQISCHSRIDPM